VIFLSSEKTFQKPKKFRTVIFIGCIVLLLFGILFTLAGVALLSFNMGTDADGYQQSEVYEVRSDSYAFVLWVKSSSFPSYLTWMSPEDIGQERWTIESVTGKELFVGWAEAVDGENYLDSGIMFSTPSTWHRSIAAYHSEIEIPESITYNQNAPSRPPAEETFWIENVQSTETSTITWDAFWEPVKDRKILIIMNADGTSNVQADIQLGFKVPIFSWLPLVIIPIGVIMCLIGVFLIRQKNK
jgi:hypothetical protein